MIVCVDLDENLGLSGAIMQFMQEENVGGIFKI